MTKFEKSHTALLVKKLETELIRHYGLVVGGKDLQKTLGYRTGESFRQAISRNTVPVATFPIKNRRGRFALSCEIALWLAHQRTTSGSKAYDEHNMED